MTSLLFIMASYYKVLPKIYFLHVIQSKYKIIIGSQWLVHLHIMHFENVGSIKYIEELRCDIQFPPSISVKSKASKVEVQLV